MLIISTLIFAVIIVFKSLQQPEIFSGIKQKNNQKYEKSRIAQKDRDHYLNRLLNYMKTKKPYLNPLLSLKSLADEIGLSPYYLSQVINDCLNQNFYDFINSYRIKECKQLLIDSSQNNKTLLEILYHAGFNSKSVFNTFFRKYTGKTPSEYRRLYNATFQSS
jgi:AraC-like DNA-binding protein